MEEFMNTAAIANSHSDCQSCMGVHKESIKHTMEDDI